MQRIELDNFRVFGAPASFDLAPVTVLTGKNNSGKSSLIKAFLVLADYLEQDDQTVLRLDGPRATRHRISEWQNLENWESSEYGNVTLSHTQGDTQFIYEFQDSGSRRPANLFRFRMIIPEIGELLFKSVSGGVYQLEVAQKFINYVVGSAEEKSKIREAASYPTRLNTLRRELADLNRKFHQANSSSTVAEDYTQLVQQRQELQNTISNLEALVVKTKSVSGIFFQTEIWSDSISRRSLSGLIQAALMKYIAGEEDDDVEDQEEDGPVAADYDPDLLDDEYWESQREQARYERETKEINESSQSSQQHFVTLNTEEERRILIQFPQAVDQQMRFTIAHSGANRTYQARLYLTGTHHSEINTIAENFQRQGVYAEGSAAAFLEYWLPQFEIGQKIRIQLVENAAIRIEVIKGNKRINLADLGFGAGQILTILLQLATLIQARDEQLLIVNKSRDLPTIALIEEPEANLHPQFQSRLAELFAEAAHRYGLQFVIETHSEYFIRNIQVLVKEQQRLNQFKVYYLDAPSEANGHKHGHEMRLREDGVFMDEFGEGFLMNESANLTFKLF